MLGRGSGHSPILAWRSSVQQARAAPGCPCHGGDGPGDSGKTTPRPRKQILPGKIKAFGHQEVAERGRSSAFGRH